MPNKPYDKLNPLDQELRGAFPPPSDVGPEPRVQLVISKIYGFELFNTRSYHNWETWSDGYRVEGYGVRVEAEDLDDAVREFIRKVRALRT